ncbi:helix-turn-helix domain-containing protein [Eubacterium sp.]|uniref:helix-turn-helix domain-containing protein n=1 Tax=Eubacterium sp. TaxID=142586 RepID=UPI0035207AA6
MAIGERIRTFRKRKGLTQKELGVQLGFNESTADIRMAQYEAEKRVPKDDLIETLSSILEVSPAAINVPDIDTHVGIMQLLFTLEDIYAISVRQEGSHITLDLGAIHDALGYEAKSWAKMKSKLDAGEISKKEYDNWRYNYPANTHGYHKLIDL